MTSRDFCYWLQGHFEISKSQELNKLQVQMVKRHLALVFKHEIDPSYGGDQQELQNIHDNDNPTQGSHHSEPMIRC